MSDSSDPDGRVKRSSEAGQRSPTHSKESEVFASPKPFESIQALKPRQAVESSAHSEATGIGGDKEEKNDGNVNKMKEVEDSGQEDDTGLEEKQDGQGEEGHKDLVEQAYSTRGRSSTEQTALVSNQSGSSEGNKNTSQSNSNAEHQWEKSVRESSEKEAVSSRKESSSNSGTSFLESLSEEYRRTPLRFLPKAEGMQLLRKNEIKGDLALARSSISSSGIATTISARKSKRRASARTPDRNVMEEGNQTSGANKENEMDVDVDDGIPPSEEDHSDIHRLGGTGTSIDIGSAKIILPSNAFIAPPNAEKGNRESQNNFIRNDVDKYGKENNDEKLNLKPTNILKSPSVVESVAAFNPPRPPESVGAKKKHRMLRWERRPADVEVDLSNYKKTVQRTREEMHTVELELERMESVGTHLRRHYLAHLKCVNDECAETRNEVSSMQTECANLVDLLSSRPKSRGSSNSHNVMKNVFSILKSRGSDLNSGKIDLEYSPEGGAQKTFSGIGGSGSAGLFDWDHDTVVESQKLASAWILPHDIVETPYGEGEVLKVYGPSPLNALENPGDFLDTLKQNKKGGGMGNELAEANRMDVSYTSNMTGDSYSNNRSSSTQKQQLLEKKTSNGGSNTKDYRIGNHNATLNKMAQPETDKLSKILPSRLCVRLPFGIGYFNASSVSSKESFKNHSPSTLGARWKKLLENSNMVTGSLDIQGMSATIAGNNVDRNCGNDSDRDEKSPTPMEIEEDRRDDNLQITKSRLLPFGSSLLPTSTGRGGQLTNGNIVELEKEIYTALYNGSGVLGRKNNYGVPMDTKKCEEQQQQLYTLEARVLQLRNELDRQRRIRKLNERTFKATKDRSLLVEGLVSEMRSDLKSLKNRLDEELRELGINDEKAESILKAFYLDQEEEEVEAEEISHLKRSRRLSRTDENFDENEAIGAGANDFAVEMDVSETGTGRGLSDDDEKEAHNSRHTKRVRHS